jgi:hypothetical protein
MVSLLWPSTIKLSSDKSLRVLDGDLSKGLMSPDAVIFSEAGDSGPASFNFSITRAQRRDLANEDACQHMRRRSYGLCRWLASDRRYGLMGPIRSGGRTAVISAGGTPRATPSSSLSPSWLSSLGFSRGSSGCRDLAGVAIPLPIGDRRLSVVVAGPKFRIGSRTFDIAATLKKFVERHRPSQNERTAAKRRNMPAPKTVGVQNSKPGSIRERPARHPSGSTKICARPLERFPFFHTSNTLQRSRAASVL